MAPRWSLGGWGPCGGLGDISRALFPADVFTFLLFFTMLLLPHLDLPWEQGEWSRICPSSRSSPPAHACWGARLSRGHRAVGLPVGTYSAAGRGS